MLVVICKFINTNSFIYFILEPHSFFESDHFGPNNGKGGRRVYLIFKQIKRFSCLT